MSDTYASPVSGSGGTPGAYPVFRIPVGVIVVRGFQIFLGFLIIVLCGLLMHGLVMSAYAFSLVCGLFTLIIAPYAILSEKATACRPGYNYWAVLSLDLLMIIFWLASMGAVAALRGSFKYTTEAECYDDGSTFNAGHCYTSKRGLAKRFAVSGKVGLAEMSAVAGLSALEMLLFVGSFAYLAHQVRLHHQAQKAGIASNDAGVVEMKGQGLGQGQPGAMANPDAYNTAYGAAQPAPSTPAYPYQPQPYEGAAAVTATGAVPPQPQQYAYPAQSYAAPAVVAPQQYAYAPQTTPSQTPAPEYQQQVPQQVPQVQQQVQHPYAVEAAQGTPEPYHAAGVQHSQPYYPPQ